MRTVDCLVGLVLLCVLMILSASPVSAEGNKALYDPGRDPRTDIRAAQERARDSGRYVLLVIGNDTCIWCYWLDRHLTRDLAAQQAVANSFEVINVYFGDENDNAAFFAELPRFEGFPHLYVLGDDGEVLASQDASVLIRERRFDTRRIEEFAASWRRTIDDSDRSPRQSTVEKRNVAG